MPAKKLYASRATFGVAGRAAPLVWNAATSRV
jgi:hypothetical protein